MSSPHHQLTLASAMTATAPARSASASASPSRRPSTASSSSSSCQSSRLKSERILPSSCTTPVGSNSSLSSPATITSSSLPRRRRINYFFPLLAVVVAVTSCCAMVTCCHAFPITALPRHILHHHTATPHCNYQTPLQQSTSPSSASTTAMRITRESALFSAAVNTGNSNVNTDLIHSLGEMNMNANRRMLPNLHQAWNTVRRTKSWRKSTSTKTTTKTTTTTTTTNNNDTTNENSRRKKRFFIIGKMIRKLSSSIGASPLLPNYFSKSEDHNTISEGDNNNFVGVGSGASDDAIHTGGYSSSSSSSSSSGRSSGSSSTVKSSIINGRGTTSQSKRSRNGVMFATTTTTANRMARMHKVSSFAKSPFATTTSTHSALASSTALHMVLSTPDTIIEQASTQNLLDALIDESVRTSSREPVMLQFNPKRGWIWRQWRGTVFSETWKSGLMNMLLATFVVFLYRMYPGMKDLLTGFSILWGQLLSVTTFTLTFFLNQSYGLWRKCYDYSRRLQGRLNDLGMTLAAHATRVTTSSPDIPSTYTPQSRQALELVSRYVRVFNLLTYASFTRSHRPILTPRGMRRLVERGILTPKEREILSNAEVPATQRHNAVLVWLIRLFLDGRQTGVFEGGTGFEQQFMEKCHVIRAQYGAIGDELQGRMPLAYAHIVQVLVDVVLWMYPFMALSTGMAWHLSILGTFLLTMFYQGLFDLAKQFLDPYDNENYGKGDDPLVIDTLIAETNAGSVRWMNSFQEQPWSKQLLKDGELFDSILPLRGYSTDELLEKEVREENERRNKEQEIKEKKMRAEEQERLKAEQMLKEHFESMGNGTDDILEEESINGTAILVAGGETLISSDGNMKSLKEWKVASLTPSDTKEASPDMNDTEVEMHKVLTLADGTLVTQDDSLTLNATETESSTRSISSDTEQEKTPASTMKNTAYALDTFDIPTDSAPPLLDITNTIAWDKIGAITPNFEDSMDLSPPPPSSEDREENDDDIFDENDDDIFEPFSIEWFEEVDENGNEYRLSQILADEDWEEFDDSEDNDLMHSLENKTMTYEEFAQKATEVYEQAENELMETVEVLSATPGREAEYDAKSRETSTSSGIPTPSLRKRKVQMEEKEPLYDQTRLDPISQLWGAPPEVLGRQRIDDEDEEEQRIINEDVDFANVYSLWGQTVPPSASASDEAAMTIPSFDGISQLWQDGPAPPDRGDEPSDNDSKPQPTYDYSAFGGIEWWDQINEDGKEISLSMMLADEEFEEALEPEEDPGPMTLEQYAKETAELIEQAEDEREETEAILNAPPGAQFLLADEDVIEDSIAASDAGEQIILYQPENTDVEVMTISDDEINVLEMDDVFAEENNVTRNYDALSSYNGDLEGNEYEESSIQLTKKAETKVEQEESTNSDDKYFS